MYNNKNNKMKKINIILCLSLIFAVSCTDDFNEINEQPDALSVSDVSAKFFVTNIQKGLFKPVAGALWFGQIFHQDQYAGQHSGGHSQYAWDGNFGWEYTAWLQEGTNGWLAGYNSSLTSYLRQVGEGGALENDQYYAIGLIMKGLYYQLYTDQVGMIPYSEASDPDIKLPKYDEQIDIYRGVIAELNEAISLIGSNTTTGEGVDLLRENDVIFNGDFFPPNLYPFFSKDFFIILDCFLATPAPLLNCLSILAIKPFDKPGRGATPPLGFPSPGSNGRVAGPGFLILLILA